MPSIDSLVQVDNLNPPISAPGHTLITSPTLPFALVTDPRVLIQFIEAAATAQGVDLGILLPEFAYVLSLPPTALTASTIIASVNPNPETCAPTGTTARVDALILAAVKNLKTNLSIQSITKLDDYQTPLDFVQNNVPTVLGDSVLNLVGLIGKSIVANIVEGSTLQFSGGLVNNVTNNGFTVALKGSLLNVYVLFALTYNGLMLTLMFCLQWTIRRSYRIPFGRQRHLARQRDCYHRSASNLLLRWHWRSESRNDWNFDDHESRPIYRLCDLHSS